MNVEVGLQIAYDLYVHCSYLLTDDSQKTSTDTELPKASRRRHHSVDNVAFERCDRVGTNKSKGSRKHHKKMNSDGNVGKSSKPRRNHRKGSLSDQEDSSKGDVPEPTSPTSQKLPDIPKKSRRKKVKDEINKIASKAIPKASSGSVNDPPPPPPPPPTTKTKTTITTTIDPGSVGTDTTTTTTTTTTTITCDSESCHIIRRPNPPIAEEEKSDIVTDLDS